mmetsp:Transcript_23549/g.65517  ORF Transcript_23549/g.65517 Transcript_23549/m.65517 type:complete len:231 (-) Transcript_23549:303-995(-)
MSDKNYFEMFRCFSGITIEVPKAPGEDSSDDGDDDGSFVSACTEPTGLGWEEELQPSEELYPSRELNNTSFPSRPSKTKAEKKMETARLRALRAKMDNHENLVRAKVAGIHAMNASPPLETIAEPDLVTATPVSSEQSATVTTTDDKYQEMEKSLRERDDKIHELEKELTETRAQLEELSQCVSLAESKAIGQTIEVFHDAQDADATVVSHQRRGQEWGNLMGKWSSVKK